MRSKFILTCLLLLAGAFTAQRAEAQKFVYGNEPGYGPLHSSFFSMGFSEVFYSASGYLYYPSPSEISMFNLGPYLNPDGSLKDGIHVFFNSMTGEKGYLLPPQAIPSVALLETSMSGGGQNPQGSNQRSSSTLRSKGSNRMIGVNAGEDYVVPGGGNSRLTAEYNFIDTDLDDPGAGAGLAGETNVYSIAYERMINDRLFLDVNYEYADDDFTGLGGAGVDIETHTIAAALSGTLIDNIYGMLIVGGSFSEGGTTVGGVQLAGASGDTFFISPGIGTNWVFGNLIIDASVSYLFQHADTVLNVGALRVAGMTEVDQLVVDLGARYNITDTLYTRVGLQYNNILDENFAAAVQLDKNWLQINSEIGVQLANGVDIYAGHAYEAMHFIYDQHTFRAGVSYTF